jgi:amidase
MGDRVQRRIVQRPTQHEIADLCQPNFLSPDADELLELTDCVGAMVDIVDELLSLPAPTRSDSPFRNRWPGRRATSGEDPFNVFTRICNVVGAETGLLAGKTVGVKDNIDVAGVPTSNASRTLAYTPSADAVVVERILAAGGTIVGKLNMDDYAFGPTGETSAIGPPLNPVDPSRSAGGSSGGSGAAVRCGAVDLALGGDQGGSARIPASYCGVVALKATHGLIPSHGMTHLDHTFDSVVPMASTVEDVALLLTAIAGQDARDPQWVRGEVPVSDYRTAIEAVGNLDGVSVAVVTESVSPEICDERVVQNLQETADVLRGAGATVQEISVPLWRHGSPITQTLLAHLMTAMVRSEGEGYGHLGLVNLERAHAFALKRRTEGHLLPIYLKTWILTASYLQTKYMNVPYAVLHNLRLQLREDIDGALQRFDLLLGPTTPTSAPMLLQPGSADSDVVTRVLGSVPYNTAPLNVSGHPAVAVPNGVDGTNLPTSAQIVARRFHEGAALQAAFIVEREQSKRAAPRELAQRE